MNRKETSRSWLQKHWPAFLQLCTPLALVSIFGPLALSLAFTIIRGRLTPDNTSDVAEILRHKYVPGLIDYTVHYYTLLLLFIFWFFVWGAGFLCFVLAKNGGTSYFEDDGPSAGQVWIYIPIGGFLCLYVLGALFFLAATPDTLNKYLTTTQSVGKVQLPIITSHLFVARTMLGLHSFLMLRYRLNLGQLPPAKPEA